MLANWADCLNFVESKLVESCFQFLLSASCFGRHSFKSNKLPNDVWLCSLICEPDKLVRHKWHTHSTHSVLHKHAGTRCWSGARSQLIHTAAERAHTSLSIPIFTMENLLPKAEAQQVGSQRFGRWFRGAQRLFEARGLVLFDCIYRSEQKKLNQKKGTNWYMFTYQAVCADWIATRSGLNAADRTFLSRLTSVSAHAFAPGWKASVERKKSLEFFPL